MIKYSNYRMKDLLNTWSPSLGSDVLNADCFNKAVIAKLQDETNKERWLEQFASEMRSCLSEARYPNLAEADLRGAIAMAQRHFCLPKKEI